MRFRRAGLAESIPARSGGTPFLAEEIVQTLMESGSLEGEPRRLSPDHAARAAPGPAIRARYRLAPDASVIFCITWSRLKLAGFCRGGKSLKLASQVAT